MQTRRYEVQLCLSPGVYKLSPGDVANDGWHGGTVSAHLGAGDQPNSVLIPVIEVRQLPSLYSFPSNPTPSSSQVPESAKPTIFEVPEVTGDSWSCSNGVQDGPESDVDCGGGCEEVCSFREKCYDDDDCNVGGCDVEFGQYLKICNDVEIEITSPVAYEMIMAGVTTTLEWEVGSVPPEWTIDVDVISADGAIVLEIARNVTWTQVKPSWPGAGQYEWKVSRPRQHNQPNQILTTGSPKIFPRSPSSCPRACTRPN